MSIKGMSSAVEDVKIFLQGAEIKRRMVLDTAEGKNVAVFDGLPHDIRQESVSASVEKGGTLVSADFETDSFREPFISKEIKELEEKLEKVKDEIRAVKNKRTLLQSEEKFLDSNRKISGKEGFAIKDLKEIEKYYNNRKEEIGSSWIETEKKLEDLEKEKERIVKELGAFPTNVVRYAGRINVEFYSESKGKAEITVSYYVNNAWWRPFHEIRMNEVGAPVALSMKGRIVQNTGEDWKDVNVKLSTGNPMLGNQQPTLYPWYIDMAMPQIDRSTKDIAYCEEMVCACSVDEDSNMKKTMRPASPAQMMTQTTESYAATEFALPAPLNIPSSNKPSKVEILKHVLEANLYYYCVSKIDADAFLIAEIKGWGSLNLLAGEVSIFQGNEYVGKTHLDPAKADDSMEISLGRDRAIIVTREKGNNLTSKGMIGKNKKVLREWVITVKNTRSKSVKMKLIDQIPVSTNSDLIVEAIETSGAELNKDTGILTWSLDIPTGGSVKKVLKYEVTYPKNGTVYLE
ncbi:MAG: mucoidy inhibitor MuiA family protein [Methanomassiliicoccaceae archaeon]|nr:mucoidy inhibitor MuiA family protein [Methanomassiliicoccaceae archaeon]